jgi:hypothetical protein
MFSPQERQRQSRRERIKSFIRNLPRYSRLTVGPSEIRGRTVRLPPNTDVDVAASRPTCVSPANSTDFVLGNDTASTPRCYRSREAHRSFLVYIQCLNSPVSTSKVATSALTGSRSRTVQATGNAMSHAPPQIADPAGPALPLSTVHTPHDHGQNSTTNGLF